MARSRLLVFSSLRKRACVIILRAAPLPLAPQNAGPSSLFHQSAWKKSFSEVRVDGVLRSWAYRGYV
jgi:hypothetical protein